MNFNNKNILILGYGKSGASAKKLLEPCANKIFIYDKKFISKILNNNKNKLNNNKNKLNNNKINKLLNKNIIFINNLNEITEKINLCILSPGIDINSKLVKTIQNKKIKIISELELGASFCKGKIIAITGTNGKTTTVNLLYNILKTAKKDVYLCGNVGTPISEIAQQTTNNSLIICEVSSFQMEATNNFRPYISAILNLKPDHLDRHKSTESYFALKEKIFKYYKTKKIININYKKITNKYKNIIYFSNNNKKINNFIKNINYYKNINLENIYCTIEICKLLHIKNKDIKTALENFKGVKHRLELVAKFNNIDFINDSKSTNIASTISALQTIKKDVILLLGGSDKNLDFFPIFKEPNIKYVFAYGETKQKIFNTCNHNNIKICKNFFDAVKNAFYMAKSNDIVLLSPASASFDEFKNFEERGETFIKLVNENISSHTLQT